MRYAPAVLALALAACFASPDGTAQQHYERGMERARLGSRASLFAQPGHALRARAELERAVELDGGHVPARTELARYYLSAPMVFGGGDAKAAAQIAALHPLAMERAAVIEGWRLHHRNEPREASRVLQNAARQFPDSAAPWFALAHALSDQGRNDDAVAALRRGLALRPDYRPGHWQLGLIGATTGTHLAAAESALKVYLDTARAKPAKAEPALHVAHWRLGEVFEKQGRYADAARQYREALRGRSRSEYREALRRVR